MRERPEISKNAAPNRERQRAMVGCGVTSDKRIDCAARASPPAGGRTRRHNIAGVRGEIRLSRDPREAALRGGK